MSIRMRHSWRKTARQWSTAEIEATQHFENLAAPTRQRLEADLRSTDAHLGHLEHQDRTRNTWLDQHPDQRLRIAAIDRELDPTPTIQERLQALEVQPPGRDRGLGLEL